MAVGRPDFGKASWQSNTAGSESADNSITVVHTVGAGKIFYLINFWLYVDNQSGGRDRATFNIYNSSGNNKWELWDAKLEDATQYGDNFTLPAPIRMTAGETVRVRSFAASLYIFGGIIGITF